MLFFSAEPDSREASAHALMTCLALVLLACSTTVAPDGRLDSAQATPTLATLDGTERHLVESSHVEQVFAIDVWQPEGIAGPLPVVYVLDGNTSFGMASQIVIPMMWARDVPPVLVVGVGYQVASPFEVVALRSRDLLPTAEAGFAARMQEVGFAVPQGLETGGADAFLAFITQELKPFIDARYPTDPANETLVGYSYGGTFAFHTLISAPSTFERYVIGSPVLARDGGELIADERSYAERTSALPATVFLSAGEYEIDNGILESVEQMIETLRKRRYEGLVLETHIFEQETHESALAPTLSRGLRAVFGTWPRKAEAGRR